MNEIDYSKVPNKQAKAISDCASWLNVDPGLFKAILTLGAIAAKAKQPSHCELAFALCGIQGYPVEACWQHCQSLFKQPSTNNTTTK